MSWDDDLANLIGSLEYGHHRVVTSVGSDSEDSRGLELLAVQITKPNLDIVISALKRLSAATGCIRIADSDMEEAAERAYEMALKTLALHCTEKPWATESDALKNRWRAVVRSVVDPAWHDAQTSFQ